MCWKLYNIFDCLQVENMDRSTFRCKLCHRSCNLSHHQQQRPMNLAPVDRALKLRQSAIVPFHPTLCSEQKFGRDR